MAEITVVKLNQFLTARELKYMGALSLERRRQIERYRRKEDAYRSYVGGLLARYMLCRYTGRASRDLYLNKNKFGKLYLANDDGCHFNLSHSGCYVACILDKEECGVDVEEITDFDKGIAKRCYHNNEYKNLNGIHDRDEARKYFYTLWTMKEAYLKKLGVGLSKPLSSFYIEIDEPNAIRIFDEDTGLWEQDNYECRYIEGGYSLSVASASKGEYCFINDSDLLAWIAECEYFK